MPQSGCRNKIFDNLKCAKFQNEVQVVESVEFVRGISVERAVVAFSYEYYACSCHNSFCLIVYI